MGPQRTFQADQETLGGCLQEQGRGRASSPFVEEAGVKLSVGNGFGGRGDGYVSGRKTSEEDRPDGTGDFHMLGYNILVCRRHNFPRKDESRAWGNLTDFLTNVASSVRVCHVLLALNVGVFALQTLLGPSLLMSGAKVNNAIAAGQYYRLFSPMFLHASMSHLLVNSFSLHSTGPSVESWFGKPRFLSLYVASGICGNALSYVCSPSPAVGASGAIFGLVGASLVVLGRHRQILGPRARKGLQSLAYVVIMNFGIGLTPGSRVDNFGHLGGFLGGIAFSYILGPRLVVERTTTGRKILRDRPILGEAISEARVRLRQLRSRIKL